MATAFRRARVLAVAEQPRKARALGDLVAGQGYYVRTAVCGQPALSVAVDWRPHLVIVELSEDHLDRVDLWRAIRQQSSASLIVLSPDARERVKVKALDAGADDYVTTPVSENELMARVRAILRRRSSESGDAFSVGDFHVEPSTLCVRIRGSEVQLTPKEFELFMYLARHPRSVIDHRTLLTEVWGDGSRSQSEYLRVYIGQLRKKLEPEPSRPRYLLTEPWVGYRFNPGGEAAQ
jgi:two-component system, OmpR family, KDP operon response regulator KdpE